VQCIEIGQALRIAARLESRGTGRGGREIREWERFKDMYGVGIWGFVWLCMMRMKGAQRGRKGVARSTSIVLKS
jgi:hypothetical protein